MHISPNSYWGWEIVTTITAQFKKTPSILIAHLKWPWTQSLKAWFALFSFRYNLHHFIIYAGNPIRTEQGQGIVFLTCRTWSFSIWFCQLPSISGPWRQDFLSDKNLLFLTHHRQPSRGPVEASRLLSVSEASVCSVDMDEMSLIDDDWEGVAWLLTAASVLREPHIMKPEARTRRCTPKQWDFRPLPALSVVLSYPISIDKKLVHSTFCTFPGVFL